MRAERIAAGSGALRVHLAPNGLGHARFGFASYADLDAELGRCLARALPLARRREQADHGDAPVPPKAENGAVRPGPRRALSPSPA